MHRKFSIFLRNDRDCKAVSYDRHILASKFFLKNKETGYAFFRKSKCDCQCLHFWHNFLYLSLSNILIWTSICKAVRFLNIFEKWSWLYGYRSIQCKKELYSNRKFGSNCFCKIKKPNKNFLKLKCDWGCSYFDTTGMYWPWM